MCGKIVNQITVLFTTFVPLYIHIDSVDRGVIAL